MAKQPIRGDKTKKSEATTVGIEGIGPRFTKGADDLEQLEGLEKQRDRSRKARRRLKKDDRGEDPDPELIYPLIETDDKSRKRVKNRFKRIKDPKDAIDEFGS